jgi:hypothetical protein
LVKSKGHRPAFGFEKAKCPSRSFAASAVDGAVTDKCRECKHPVVEIDNRGTRLTGCMTCNIWQDQDGHAVKLSVEDLAALHALRK